MEDQRKLEYGKAMSELTLARQEEDRINAERSSVTGRFRSSVSNQINPGETNRYNDYLRWLKKSAERQKDLVAKAEEEAARRMASLVEAMRERKALEILKDKRYAEYANEEKLAEQKITDEIVSYRGSEKLRGDKVGK